MIKCCVLLPRIVFTSLRFVSTVGRLPRRFLHTFLGRSLDAASNKLQHAARCLRVFSRLFLTLKDIVDCKGQVSSCRKERRLFIGDAWDRTQLQCAVPRTKIIWGFRRLKKKRKTGTANSCVLDYNTHERFPIFGRILVSLSAPLGCQVCGTKTVHPLLPCEFHSFIPFILESKIKQTREIHQYMLVFNQIVSFLE